MFIRLEARLPVVQFQKKIFPKISSLSCFSSGLCTREWPNSPVGNPILIQAVQDLSWTRTRTLIWKWLTFKKTSLLSPMTMCTGNHMRSSESRNPSKELEQTLYNMLKGQTRYANESKISRASIFINGNKITTVKHPKFLGVIIDEKCHRMITFASLLRDLDQ